MPNVVGVVPTVSGNAEVAGNGRVRRTSIFGGSAAMLRVFNVRVHVGQFLPEEQGGEARNLVVLGPTLKAELFGAANALGTRLRIGGLQFRVVGVLEPKGQFLGIDLDDTAYIPAARAMELFNREGLTEIHLSYAEGASSARVASDAKKLLAARHGREDFTITTQEEMLRTLGNILDMLTMAIGGLGSISLLVGAGGHRHDHDHRRGRAHERSRPDAGAGCAAAHDPRPVPRRGRRSGRLGGAMGLALGIGLAQLIHVVVPALPVHTPVGYAVLAVVLAALIGLGAGVLPARRASRLDPVESLRTE